MTTNASATPPSTAGRAVPSRPADATFAFSRQLFLRLLGLVYFIAFVSLAIQITGLVGSRGILPVGQLLAGARSQYGAEAYRLLPTLLWLGSSDAVLTFLCWAGAAIALIAIAGRGVTLVFVLLWALYLSLTVAGQVFLEFQWDALLLEAGLLACLYAPLRFSSNTEPNPIVRWVLWGLACKLTFLSGITKILSGDPSWAAWTAMTYHYETQPIPAWTSWYAHQLPAAFHYWSVPATLAVELAAPFAVFLPGRFWWTRLVACTAMILFQLGIAATGNYGFFNLLAIVLYLALFDDQTLRLRPPGPVANKNVPREPVAWRVATSTIAIGIAVVSAITFVQEMERTAGTPVQLEGVPGDRLVRWLSPFRSINGYGLFRVMTTSRPEIVIEVSEDGQQWREYEFRWKPGDPRRRPRFVEPHMPRLDWQMWFAALDPGGAQYWLDALLQRILAGEPVVRRLLGPSPLSGPPRFARLAYYRYTFTTPAERGTTGAWWVRRFEGYLTEPIQAR